METKRVKILQGDVLLKQVDTEEYKAMRTKKQKEQDEIRREQRLIQKEIEKRARFEEIDKNLKSSSRGLENFNIDKSKEN